MRHDSLKQKSLSNEILPYAHHSDYQTFLEPLNLLEMEPIPTAIRTNGYINFIGLIRNFRITFKTRS